MDGVEACYHPWATSAGDPAWGLVAGDDPHNSQHNVPLAGNMTSLPRMRLATSCRVSEWASAGCVPGAKCFFLRRVQSSLHVPTLHQRQAWPVAMEIHWHSTLASPNLVRPGATLTLGAVLETLSAQSSVLPLPFPLGYYLAFAVGLVEDLVPGPGSPPWS